MKPFVLVVGGGPAGMAAALECSKSGVKTILVERENRLGGILNQCIHNGFGLSYFGEELTGPEYAAKFVEKIKSSSVEVWLETFVTKIESGKVCLISKNGAKTIYPSAVILAMGAREKTAGNIKLLGTRPVGVFTAGQVQKLVNHFGLLPGKRAIIIGSGDIGLIMARRLSLEGAKVLGVYEIMSTSSGLARNISSCLNDFGVPLFLSTTIIKVQGDKRVSGVWTAKVDGKLSPISGTENFVECDTVLLSVGLVPENDIVVNLEKNKFTNGAVVSETRETNLSGVFSCGNVLQIHDLVDNACLEAELAGKNAALFAQNLSLKGKRFEIETGKGIRQVVPNYGFEGEGKIELMFRTSVVAKKCFVRVKLKSNGKKIAEKYSQKFLPSQLQKIVVDKSRISNAIYLELEEVQK